ncbi:hypothetical protein BPOR_0523g00030 [Botrytis porri]|uniref:Uncharacterized protein n=1 Tax=Botrytis porri TaxID=87229 RepID=A0A4Z1KL33_9HELO|nr:hypothetical protein BPOR_0523g00030 [Botrytis porri]
MIASPTSISGWLKTDSVLDAQAADVVKELKSHGVYIDPILLPTSHPKTTIVYHMRNLTPGLAEALYQAGFLDINARDHKGWLPILAQTNFKNGCLPITCFLGNLQVEFSTGNPEDLCGSWEVLGDDPWVTWRFELMVRIFAKMLESKLSTCPWLVRNIIRQCTFYKLGLTHTCKCSQRICPPASSFTKDEVCNIMEEERDMIEQLESVTAELEKNFANSGKPLHAFLKDDWKPMMEEIMSESTSDENYIKGVRELGVIMR